jgi:hypothetical protein
MSKIFKKLEELTFGKIDPLYHDLVERLIMVGVLVLIYYFW